MEGELTLRLSRKDLEALAVLVAKELRPVLQVPTPSPEAFEDLMTAKEVQEFLKIKPSAFYERLKNKDLPEGIRVGPKARRWRREEIVNCTRDGKGGA